MKTATRVLLAGIIGVVFSMSTAFAGDPPFSGFLGGPSTYDLLTPGPKDGAKLLWVKSGVDFTKYKKFMVDSVIFYLADKADHKGIDPQEMKELADAFNKELVAVFKDKYPIVAEPGPDVARIRFAITNIRPSKPGVSTITSIVPVGLGISLVKKGAGAGWSGAGETGAELIILDTTTNEAIGLAVDQQQAAFTERFSKFGSANDAFKFWAEGVVKYIENAKGKSESAK